MENLKEAVFSVCNVAYLPKAMVLAKSLYEADKIVLDLFLFDKKREIDIDNEYCRITWIEDVNIPYFEHLAFKYNVIEFTTSMKPFLALYLLKKYSKVVFFDPDVMIFNTISPILENLNKSKFLITPHFFTPNSINDLRLMRFGFFNLGFFACDNSSESKEILEWWNQRCFEECFDDSQFGVFTDQKWLSIAPYYFPSIKIVEDLGYNVAYWNLYERTIIKAENTYYINKIEQASPLIFFHFSSLSKDNSPISYRDFDKGENTEDVLNQLTVLYKKEIKNINIEIADNSYSYDFFDNGDFISPTLRRAYAACIDHFGLEHNPFQESDKMKKFIKRNYLSQKKQVLKPSKSYADIDKNKGALKIYYSLLKLILRIVGPTKFMDLSRLFYYSSSYQRLINFWKI